MADVWDELWRICLPTANSRQGNVD
jgi:hypothetical protein